MNRADRSLKCDECESSFAKMAHLIRHKTSIHRSEVKPPPTIDPEALEQQQESTTPPATVKNETPSEVKPSLPKISGKPQLCTECGEFVQQRCPVIQNAKFLIMSIDFSQTNSNLTLIFFQGKRLRTSVCCRIIRTGTRVSNPTSVMNRTASTGHTQKSACKNTTSKYYAC